MLQGTAFFEVAFLSSTTDEIDRETKQPEDWGSTTTLGRVRCTMEKSHWNKRLVAVAKIWIRQPPKDHQDR